MSTPLAGKFQDHYEVLGIESGADPETIQRMYRELALKFHPSNPDTGDPEAFQAVNLAYEILSDPVLRREFDKIKGIGEDAGSPKFSGLEFFDTLGNETGIRSALLCLLYDRRRKKPFTPSLSIRHIESMLAVRTEELTVVLWYLKQKGLVLSDDKSSLQITMEGMDYLESNRPAPEVVMPFIKASALEAAEGAPPTPDMQAADGDGGSRRNALNRILAREAD